MPTFHVQPIAGQKCYPLFLAQRSLSNATGKTYVCLNLRRFQRGVTDFLEATRSQPQAFRASVKPEQRSLLDWVRTLNVYPEPDAYTGQKVKVQGFVVHPPELPPEYFLLSRFVITCCAADAYPVGLPVKLTENRGAYPPDTWLEVEGQMLSENLAGKRQLTIQASLPPKKISEPKNPYEY